ncbi:MAG: prephenate dehydrogenase, partial [Limisphaerales bacterium]
MRWKKVTLVGVGLLGGSLGLALRKGRLADSVVGFVRRAASVTECKRVGAVDWATCDLAEAVEGAQLVVLCTPIRQMRLLIEQCLSGLAPGTIVTDVGSVKAGVVEGLEGLVVTAGAHFIGSHPMAGAEKIGVAAAKPDLFANAICIVTPTRASNRAALRRVEQLWRGVGSRVVRLSPEMHDRLVSRSSHLPHVVAAGLANFVLGPGSPRAQSELCANGFRDTTRVASGSPEMWRDIALANRENLLEAVSRFVTGLQDFKRALTRGDERAISRFFEQAKQRRDLWSRRA